MTDTANPWARAMRALAALAVDPNGLKGLCLRARAGPVRQSFETAMARIGGAQRRIHPDLSDTQLFGGLDVSASLAEQRLVRQKGLSDTPCLLILTMAERTRSGLAARLGQILDSDRGHALVMLDEGVDPDERAPAALRERLAFEIDLDGLSYAEAGRGIPGADAISAARERLPRVKPGQEHLEHLTAIATHFGIQSLRAPLLALRAALALAALDGRDMTSDEDIREAAELVYAPRATRLPEPSAEPEPPSPEEPQESPDDDTTRDGPLSNAVLEDMVIAAVAAQLPKDLLERAAVAAPARGNFRGSGAGARRKGNRRGRPLPSRAGRLDGQSRIDIIATLRIAAPFQTLRRRVDLPMKRVFIHPSDIRLRRFEDKSDRLLIFAVDASGSSAMARMAEAKGAVELMLAQAYAKRDQVSLVSFRGDEADLLLPPTRSLVQAKRRLSALPGGGGTPLAAGILAAADLAEAGRAHGLSPSLILLTDGRANVALSGEGGRDQARADAENSAGQVRRLGLPSVVIDTAARPGQEGAALASWLGAHYLALPRADAHRISAAADAALSG